MSEKEGYLKELEVLRIFIQILLGVHFMHENGIYHRDLKLNNILVFDELNFKIADLGFSRKVPKAGS